MKRAEPDIQWWKPGPNAHSILADVCKEIQERGGYRRDLNLHHLRLYTDRNIAGLSAGSHMRTIEAAGFRRPRLSLNIVRSCIDSAASVITRGRPAIQYGTDGADFGMQQRAKARSKFVMGCFQQQHAYDLGGKAFRDAGIFGTGFVKVLRRSTGPLLETVFPGEVWVDDAEGIYGDPPSMFQLRPIDKLRLKGIFPSSSKAIDDAEGPDVKLYGRTSIANQAMVYEGWHLPSAPGAKDGVHIIATDTSVLKRERYEHDAFPIVPFRWNEEPLGFWGTGIAYELTGLQYEINALLRFMQTGCFAAGGLKWLAEKGSKIAPGEFNNDAWASVMHYVGQAPIPVTPLPFNMAYLDLLRFYIEQGYATVGISQLGARGEIPAGLAGSGRAQLVYKDIESQRFLDVQRRYERFYGDLAERVLEAASDVYADNPKAMATYQSGKLLERIAFADIGDDGDEFCVQPEAVSMLPFTAAGKFALAEQWRAAGYIDAVQAKRMALSGVPDVGAESSLAIAPIDVIDDQLERILERGEPVWPDPRGDVETAFARGTLAFQRAEVNGAPADRLDMLAEYIDAAAEMLRVAEAGAAPPPAGTAQQLPAVEAPMPETMGAEVAAMPPEGMAA